MDEYSEQMMNSILSDLHRDEMAKIMRHRNPLRRAWAAQMAMWRVRSLQRTMRKVIKEAEKRW